jgi:hypothetical protein
MNSTYTRYFKEQESDIESKFDKKVDSIIKILRDEDFSNEDQRKKFIDLLTSLHSSSDPRARQTFKLLGKHLTNIGNELLNYGKDNGE